MELKNITSYNEFRKTFEAFDEFSNKTGFAESLVGRAVFGILRYFKKGVNLGRLEFYKRRLENEYFAGILRFCAVKDIDLLTGIEPSGTTVDTSGGGGGGGTVDPKEADYCNIFNVDYTETDINKLVVISNTLSGYTTTLLTIINDPGSSQEDKDDSQELFDHYSNMVKCCQEKIAVNRTFITLSGLSGSTDPQIIGLLDQIKNFLSGPTAQLCSTYKGTDSEKILLRSFETSTDTNIQNKITTDIIPLLDNYNYDNYELIEEKITSGLNKHVNITQMLGDQLTTPGQPAQMKINIYDWLKDKGIDDVNKINFVELEKLFRTKTDYRKQASEFVNPDGIRKIQYAVSRIIFHVKKTPDSKGINPGEGGKVNYEEDTSLKTSWEKKVEFVKSEFKNFLLVDKELDPFVLLNYTDSLRRRDYAGDRQVLGMASTTNALANSITLTTKAQLLGINPLGQSNNIGEKRLVVFTMTYNGLLFYPVFSFKKIITGGIKVYKYVGNINFSKILSDKEYEKSDWMNNAHDFATAVWDRPKTNSDNNLIETLKLKTSPPTESGFKFDAIYLTKGDYSAIGSYKNAPQSWNVRLLYVFVNSGQINSDFGTVSTVANNFKVKYLYRNILQSITALDKIKTETKLPKMLYVSFGEAYEIEQSWYDKYFDTGNISKYITTNPYIGDAPFSSTINLIA